MNDIICKHNVTKRKAFTAEMFAIAIVLAILFILRRQISGPYSGDNQQPLKASAQLPKPSVRR